MKLTPEFLRKIVLEEAAKLSGKPEEINDGKAEKPTEVDADELGTDKTLEKPKDFLKMLDIKEAKAIAYVKKIREVRARLAKKTSK